MSEPESRPLSGLDPELERIIEKISTEHRFDLRGYKRSTLYRRIRKRMSDIGAGSAGDYLGCLEADGAEHARLIGTILINVTEFLRDPEAWACLTEHLVSLASRRPPDEPFRVWSVGCASGEEAYSLGMCLADALGEACLREAKIYATDVDESALAAARTGIYTAGSLYNVSPERLERYFQELPGNRYKVCRELRAAVIFGRHNALVDPPIARLNLLICRNLLIYFDSETQKRLLVRFHYALRDEGCLFLGKAETLMTRSLQFRPLEPRFRIFQRLPMPDPDGDRRASPEPFDTPTGLPGFGRLNMGQSG